MVSWLVLEATSDKCERDKSRTVRKVVYQDLLPIYKELGLKVPYQCPFLKDRDRYIDNEDHKERDSVNKWSCGYCGKAFIGEIYLDAHFDNRHAGTVYNEKDSVCLADFCEIFRCDVVSGAAQATFWDVALCMEEDMKDLTQDCLDLLDNCIPDSLSWNVTNRLKSSLTSSVCSFLTCKKYWDTPIVPGEEEPSTAYIVFTVLLIVGMSVYYCVAVNYFLTDTFADMYDSDEYVGRNSESLTNVERMPNPKKMKHRTRPKLLTDTESFLNQDRFSARVKAGPSRDRTNKRRHLETNEDMFNIRSPETASGLQEIDLSSSREDGHIDIERSSRDVDNIDIDIKETDYR